MVYNRTCVNCGSKYYVCNRCVQIGAYKNYCCSRECYNEAVKKGKIKSPNKINENGGTVMRAALANGKTVDINGYDIELGKFDCSDGRTREIPEFDYFIVPKKEMKQIGDRFSEVIEQKSKIKNKFDTLNASRRNTPVQNQAKQEVKQENNDKPVAKEDASDKKPVQESVKPSKNVKVTEVELDSNGKNDK